MVLVVQEDVLRLGLGDIARLEGLLSQDIPLTP